MRFSTVSSWLDYLGSVHRTEIELGLDRISKVAKHLGVLEKKCPVITVGGTNGKGSVVAALQSMYQSAGFNVGTYTSPSLIQFNERICINGEMIDDESLCEAFENITVARGDVTLTPFEYYTLAALLFFQKKRLDVLILEIGLGGRLDAVNIIDPDCAVVTSIGMDHMDRLGNTRGLIGVEKAGIYRKDIPDICGDANPPEEFLTCAQTFAAQYYQQGKDFSYQDNGESWNWRVGTQVLEKLPKNNLLIQNMSSALMAVHCMQQKLPISEVQIQKGLAQVKLSGRMQIIPGDVQEIYDVAHNVDSAQVLAERLQACQHVGKTYAVFSMLNNKDIAATVKMMASQMDYWFVGPLDDKRAASTEQLRQAFAENKIESVQIGENLLGSYQQAKQTAKPGDRIVVFGSFSTVGEVMRSK